ncbi:hypothetical protein LCL85_00330 [Vibrio alginolyticus]|nr:hypothetical protein [Vibrio alginolyticus]
MLKKITPALALLPLTFGVLAHEPNDRRTLEGTLGRDAFIVGMCETFSANGDVFEMLVQTGEATANEMWVNSRKTIFKLAIDINVDTRTRDLYRWGQEKAYRDLKEMTPSRGYNSNYCTNYAMSIFGIDYQ